MDFSFAEENEQIATWLTQLKEYQQLEADGKLLKLPCKDTVYTIVTTHIFGDIGDKAEKDYRVDKRRFSLEMLDEFGKMVFLTREDAKKKLSELKEGEYDYEY